MSFDIDNPHAAAVHTAGDLVDRLGPGPLVVLAVWSHPDDESFLAGGILAEIADRGGRVVNVTATSGEHGTSDPEAEPPAALADRRERELAAALEVLGVESNVRLGFADGVCHDVPAALGARYVGAVMDRIRPDVVLTFDRDGVTGHPDHRAVSRWTRRALADRGDSTPLVWAAPAASWPATLIDHLHSIDAFWPGLPATAPESDTHTIRLDARLTDRKLRALGCHASQMERVERALGPKGFRSLASIEAYRPGNPIARRLMNDELVLSAA